MKGMRRIPKGLFRRKIGGQLGRTLQSSPQFEEWSLQVRRTIREGHPKDLKLHTFKILLQLGAFL